MATFFPSGRSSVEVFCFRVNMIDNSKNILVAIIYFPSTARCKFSRKQHTVQQHVVKFLLEI